MAKHKITEDLQEILRKAPDSLLDMIWENIEGESLEDVKRDEKNYES